MPPISLATPGDGLRTFRMTLQYDGTRFLGWQTQTAGGTVQDAIEASLRRILGHPVRVHGAGRTDRGVHARGQVASFSTANRIAPERLFQGLNALLPPDVAAIEWAEAPAGFHARHSARSREYVYQLWRLPVCSPFARRFVYHLHRPLDRAAMEEAASELVGSHDFASFCAAESRQGGTQLRVESSGWETAGPLWIYRVRAERFLHHMVRTIVGTLIEVGTGRREPASIAQILAARDRRAAGPNAPAAGLFLERVSYERPPDGGMPEGSG